ncbi:MAG TPA: ACT domain-containing protein, partial [Blastocatellia bacterium]|nr:ACT domain-containing protein [Blastocatellia bacterium]
TAVCSARTVVGPDQLLRRLNSELDRNVYGERKSSAKWVELLKAELESAHARFGPSICMQEPNLKEGPGGLRDLHTAVWAGRESLGCNSLEQLLERGHISSSEFAVVRKAYEFLLKVRNESHFQAGRKADLLTLDSQPAIAEQLGYKDAKGLMASEILMRDYYRRASEIHNFAQDFLRFLESPGKTKNGRPVERGIPGLEKRTDGLYLVLRRESRPENLPGGFTIAGNEVHYGGVIQDFLRRPVLALEAIDVAQTRNATLASKLKREIASLLPAATSRLSSSAEGRELFLRIMGRRGKVGLAVRMMRDCGILFSFIPEFARITFLVQHDYYHRYTIDEHSIKAVEALDELAGSQDEKTAVLRSVFDEVDDASGLYLAVLLHDIGKGKGSGHVERGARLAEKVLTRIGLEPDTSATIIFLIGNHLLLSHLSQRRDLADDHLIGRVVQAVSSSSRLNMLLLLTYADISGVGPGVWNEWKSSLLLELYSRTRARFLGQPDREAGLHGEHSTGAIGDGNSFSGHEAAVASQGESAHHINMMPPRYMRATSASDVETHVRMISGLETEPVVVSWRNLVARHCTEVTIAAKDETGVFARIAGTLTSHGLNILSADIYTRSDGAAVDTFKVCEVGSHHPLRKEQWARVEQNLIKAFSGEYDVRALVEKWVSRQRTRTARKRRKRKVTSVTFDQVSSAGATVMEVRSDDEPGLAFRVADRIASMGLNIEFAKLATEKGHILDIFYLTGSSGDKLSDELLPEVERGVLGALAEPAAETKEAV